MQITEQKTEPNRKPRSLTLAGLGLGAAFGFAGGAMASSALCFFLALLGYLFGGHLPGLLTLFLNAIIVFGGGVMGVVVGAFFGAILGAFRAEMIAARFAALIGLLPLAWLLASIVHNQQAGQWPIYLVGCSILGAAWASIGCFSGRIFAKGIRRIDTKPTVQSQSELPMFDQTEQLVIDQQLT